MAANYGYDGFAGADPYAATYGAYNAPPAAYGGPPPFASEEIQTIFITGFPNDVKERELNNLLRFLPGYEASQMNWKNGQAQGFALFSTGVTARGAIQAISGLCFDETNVLRCEMAHKNMYLKDDPASKRARISGSFSGPFMGGPGVPGGPVVPTPRGPPAFGGGGGGAAANVTKDNPPCNTLFVGNLGDNVSEAELRSLFSSQPGFKQLKIVRNARNTSCFVEFDDIPTAAAVHGSQQGAILASSDRGGIRIQFSKNPFGHRKGFDP